MPAPGSPIRSDWPQSMAQSYTDQTWTRWGCELVGTQSVTTGALTDIAYQTENYDSHGFHAAGAASLVIPAGGAGVYLCTVYVDANGTLNGPSSVQIGAGGARLAVGYIPANNRYGLVSAIFPAAVGGTISTKFQNGHSGTVSIGALCVFARVTR